MAEPAEQASEQTAAAGQHVAIITGLSGAGKTAASKIFEDLGYTVVDNVPARARCVISRSLSPTTRSRYDRVALVAGRTARAMHPSPSGLHSARCMDADIEPQIVFLEASDEALIRRYSETRHRHPLDDRERRRRLGDRARAGAARRHPGPGADDDRYDSDLAFKQLRERMHRRRSAPSPDPSQLSIQVITFGFKYGVPLESDLVFDVRFMENPYYRPELRESLGSQTDAGSRLRPRPAHHRAVPGEHLDGFFATVIPAYLAEGKTRLTIAIGCTGGFHRSVAIGEALAGAVAVSCTWGPVHRLAPGARATSMTRTLGRRRAGTA